MTRLRRVVGGAVLLGAALVTVGGTAAAGALFVIGEGPYEPSDGKLTIEVVNLSGEELTVSLESDTCGSTNRIDVPADTAADVTFELVAGCEVDDPVGATVVGAWVSGSDDVPITLTAPDDEDADLSPLAGYWIGLAGGFVLTLLTLMLAVGRPTRDKLRQKMGWLGKDWKFDESWAANAGAAAAIVTGVFGATDVLDELLGNDADTQVAVIGAAITAGMVGAAPMLLKMFKSEGKHTRGGVFLATWAVLAAHFGLIVSLVLMLDGGDASTPAWIAGAGGIVLLAAYTVRTMPGVFDGEEEAEKTPADVEQLKRIAAGVERIGGALGVDLLADQGEPEEPAPPAIQQRAALL